MDRCRGAIRLRFVGPSSQKRHGIRARRLLSQSGLAGQWFDRLAPPLSFGIRLPAHPGATARRWRQAWGPSRAAAPAAWRSVEPVPYVRFVPFPDVRHTYSEVEIVS